MSIRIKLLYIGVSILCFSFPTCQKSSETPKPAGAVYTTWRNLCFDRAAAIWLIHTFVDSTARFEFLPFGESVRSGIPLDVPGAELGRQQNKSCFETILQKYNLDDPQLQNMAKLIHDIDVNTWGPKQLSISDSLSAFFNTLRETAKDDHQLIEQTKPFFQTLYHSKEFL